MLVHQIEFGSPGFDELVYLRDIMLRQPLGLKFSEEEIAEEYTSTHFGAYTDELDLLGVLVMKPLSDKQVKMRQVAVYPSAQKRGVGQAMVAASELFAAQEGFDEIVLSARVPAVPFYEKLGYEVVGDMYKEVGIDHYKMRKALKSQ